MAVQPVYIIAMLAVAFIGIYIYQNPGILGQFGNPSTGTTSGAQLNPTAPQTINPQIVPFDPIINMLPTPIDVASTSNPITYNTLPQTTTTTQTTAQSSVQGLVSISQGTSGGTYASGFTPVASGTSLPSVSNPNPLIAQSTQTVINSNPVNPYQPAINSLNIPTGGVPQHLSGSGAYSSFVNVYTPSVSTTPTTAPNYGTNTIGNAITSFFSNPFGFLEHIGVKASGVGAYEETGNPSYLVTSPINSYESFTVKAPAVLSSALSSFFSGVSSSGASSGTAIPSTTIVSSSPAPLTTSYSSLPQTSVGTGGGGPTLTDVLDQYNAANAAGQNYNLPKGFSFAVASGATGSSGGITSPLVGSGTQSNPIQSASVFKSGGTITVSPGQVFTI
jgi:hypothetical protein